MKRLFLSIFLLLIAYCLLLPLSLPALAQTPGQDCSSASVDCKKVCGPDCFCNDTDKTCHSASVDRWQKTGEAYSTWIGSQHQYQVSVEGGLSNLDNLITGSLVRIERATILSVAGKIETAYDKNGSPYYTYEGGAAQTIGNLTAYLYNKPASSVEYIADLGSNLGLVKTSYAQGLGFTAFSPILTIWKIFRNIAYMVFIIIFIIIGFMIMFRKKIDPRTVVTVQEALPRIIITLILVTFSYAIAGFFIDTGDFIMRFTGSALKNAGLIAQGNVIGSVDTGQQILNNLYVQNVFQLINPIRNVDHLVSQLEQANAPLITGAPLGLGELTARLIFIIAGIFIMFKIFFTLIGPYVGIVISIIFSPFILLLSAIPGTSNSVGSWIRGLLSKILVFPATFALLSIAAAIKGYTSTTSTWGGSANWGILENHYQISWAPAVIGNWGSAIGDIIAFGILFTVPHVVEMIQSSLQVKPQPWEAASGQEIKSAASKLPVIGGIVSRQM